MAGSARVHSLSALRRFQAAVVCFQEETAAALEMLRQDVHRMLDWIDHNRPSYWRREMQKQFDQVGHARSAFSRKQMFAEGGLGPSSIDERVALAKSKRRLEAAVAQQQVVKNWQVKLHRAADEFAGRIGRLDHMLHRDLPQLRAQLERIIASLEAYVSIAAPAGSSSPSAQHVDGGHVEPNPTNPEEQ